MSDGPDFLATAKVGEELAELRDALRRTQAQLAKAKVKKDEMVEAVYQAAHDALIAQPFQPTPRPAIDKRRKRPEVALWHLTDWQGAKETVSYNSEVMHNRVIRFTDVAASITEIQRADHPVNDCSVLFGGDMIEGLFNFPNQVFEIDATLFAQWDTVSELLAETVQRALAIYPGTVTVVAEWGNHGRIGSKRDAVPTSDNFDRMCYETARKILRAERRLVWEDCPEDIQNVEIGNYRALLLHGDETGRNGFVSPTTFLTYINKLKAGGYGWRFRDVYSGHYHTHHDLPMADGEGVWYQTGSTESDNRYARNGLGTSARPSQRLHFIDPEKGRVSAQYKIWLD